MENFEELCVIPAIRKAIEEMGYENPMPVQKEVIPYLLNDNNNDLIALAQTGTGKTAAYGLPILQQINITENTPQALILCPTRELCLQIADDLKDYSKYIYGLKVLAVYGGSSIESQIRNLRQGVHVIVATPGRLIDLIERKTVSLSTILRVVLDEADEMLNMGFSESIKAIFSKIPEERNTYLFSATMSNEIARIAKNYLHNAKEIVIGNKNEGTANVKHVVYTVHAKDKYATLKRIVDYYPEIYGIVFCRTKIETQEIADKLMQDGYNADALHGDLSQAQRDVVMQKFRIKNLQILVATDVAARGLDVENLTHIINYGLPDDVENYTHRSGRTGRADKTGTSIAIINLREKSKIHNIEKIIGKKFAIGTIPTGREICEKQLLKVIDDLEKVKVNEEEIANYMPDIYRKLDWLSKEDLIKRIVSLEFNRFLDYYHGLDDIENIPENERNKSNEQRRKTSHSAEPGYTRLFINIGKMDNFFVRDLISMINSNIHGKRINVGKIDLMKTYSFFEVKENQVDTIIRSLCNIKWKGRKINIEPADNDVSKKDSRNNSDLPKNKNYSSKKIFAEEKVISKKDDWRQFFEERPLKKSRKK